jgi:hypothetical protein
MSEQPKATISFTVTPHYAALLIAAYDILMHDAVFYDDWSTIAPQTLENYGTLLDILRTSGVALLGVASNYSENVTESIRKHSWMPEDQDKGTP